MSLTAVYVYYPYLPVNNLVSTSFFHIALYILILLTVFSFVQQPKLQLVTTAVFNPLTILEEELGALEDYVVLGIIFLSTLAIFTAAPLIFSPFFTIPGLIITSTLLVTTGFFVPLSTLARFGVELPAYVRGSGKTSFFFYEFVLDTVAILTIFVRFFVQNIRIVFLVFAYWELYAFSVHTILLDDLLSFELLTPVATPVSLFQLFTTTLLYLYYTGHLIILYTIQVTAYLGLSFWLFFFLYTNFSTGKKENYFTTNAPKSSTSSTLQC